MLIDISPLISNVTPVWPGDTQVEREILLSHERGDCITLSTIRATTHVGAHSDAPLHVISSGADISQISLEHFIGECQVIDLVDCGSREILPADIKIEIRSPRVLFRLAKESAAHTFPEVFAYPAPELIEFLHVRGVITFGTTSPSVDSFRSKNLPSHHALFHFGMAILEGLLLDAVSPGTYELIALPLRLAGFDASPVRAVLRCYGSEMGK